jgi:cytochrome c5
MSKAQDALFFYNFSLIIGGLALLAVLALVGANIIYEEYRISQQEEEVVAERIRPVGEVNVSGASLVAAVPSRAAPTAEAGATSAPEITDPGERAYRRICFSCHDMGIGGAPKLGDPVAWQGRAGKGIDTLMQSVINGVTSDKGVMLPRGGLPDMTDEEIRAATTYMLKQLDGGAAPAAGDPPPAESPVPAEQEPPPQAANAGAQRQEALPVNHALADRGRDVYDTACWVCHAPGTDGAPKFGDRLAWAPLIAKGIDTLVKHSIDGFTGSSGLMPAKGSRPDLSDDDVKAAVVYMVANSR